ncbi:MAG TPA: MFS transporter [Micropepsaceae bacterium]|nr:MFS transporter [Micropepsaceae bacterium]
MDEERNIFARCARRLVPLIAILYFVNYVDRVNVSFAGLTMNHDMGFSPFVYGLGGSLFFGGYLLFQIPANVVLERVGARRWIFAIMAVWGALSIGTAFIQGPKSFYALRFSLGVAEAGFFPGMVLYLTYWFPQSYRARFVAGFMTAIPMAFVVGAPLSGVLLQMEGVLSLRGWQWLFVIEGLPAFVLAFVVLRLLPDRPATASWLVDDEKLRISARLEGENVVLPRAFWPALVDPRVIALGLVYFGINFGRYGVELWLPQIVQGMGYSNLVTTLLVAIPYGVGIVAMIVWGLRSDSKGERIRHVALPCVLAAAGCTLAAVLHNDLLVLVAFGAVVVSLLAVQGPFFSLPSAYLGGTAVAGGIGLVNMLGTGMGGLLGPSIMGYLKENTGGYASGMAVLALALLFSAAVVLAIGRTRGASFLAARTSGNE